MHEWIKMFSLVGPRLKDLEGCAAMVRMRLWGCQAELGAECTAALSWVREVFLLPRYTWLMPTSSKRAKDRPTGKTHCLGTWSSSQQRDWLPSGLFLTMSSSSTRLGSVLLDFPGQSHFPTSRPLVTACVQSSGSEHVFPINKKSRKETCSSCLQPALVTSVIPVSPSTHPAAVTYVLAQSFLLNRSLCLAISE